MTSTANHDAATGPYLAEHVRDRLARDPRVGELDVHVTVGDDTVVLTGTVATHERREAVTEVVHELLPDHEVWNGTVVASYPEPTAAEHLA